ncbi:hypothetical protein G6F46_009348 [Rhizopus delemar]|uniref:Uncharacterized protein n=2 Tax=Rhizopus TaxID=4842 RepID=A0A9P6ZC67_9FUNG|nr:hypothetical protein G6F36_012279 [Rhizopus arrhizus]KAG1457481.1 hypothetical protein G6F55_005911 [Rhizopus delemar]KAG1500711.1 hypothetical protein G6F54_003535 [Rhizopus delemar]KAG1510746.1 hypothetical protein G6F52_010823 [Rhizopus delemar]KAG1518253.1 hypothetical protein G6F53_000738 [Rhizopus delemar]
MSHSTTYTTGNVEWKDDSLSDVLLIPHEHCNYPPILMEYRCGSKPLNVIFAVTGVQPKDFQGTFQPTSKPYIHSASCMFWATNYLLLAPQTSVSIVDEIESSLDLLLPCSDDQKAVFLYFLKFKFFPDSQAANMASMTVCTDQPWAKR